MIEMLRRSSEQEELALPLLQLLLHLSVVGRDKVGVPRLLVNAALAPVSL